MAAKDLLKPVQLFNGKTYNTLSEIADLLHLSEEDALKRYWALLRNQAEEFATVIVDGERSRSLEYGVLVTFIRENPSASIYIASEKAGAILYAWETGYQWTSVDMIKLAPEDPNPPDTLMLSYDKDYNAYWVVVGSKSIPPWDAQQN